MARGRPPKPVERLAATQRDANHKANGTEIARIEVSPDRTIPVPVTTYTGRGLDEWQKVWLAGWWLKREQDYHWVEMIAQAYEDIEVFRKRVEADGLVVTGYAGQVVAHPLIAEIRRCEQTIQKCLSILGFSPSDRARLNLVEVKTQNALQKMLADAQNEKPGGHGV